MTHLTCPKCNSTEHTCGYGLAAGPIGSYCFCDGCEILLEAHPDTEGLEDTEVAQIKENLEKPLRQVWGDAWEKHA